MNKMEGHKMNFKHSFNNGLGNKPESNQQQVSLNQGNIFNASSQQQYQQNNSNQNYNPMNSVEGGQIAQQYGQHLGQNVSSQQYSQQKNSGVQQYQPNNSNQNYHPITTSERGQSQQYLQQQNLMQRPPQFGPQKNSGVQQYQQNIGAQNYNAINNVNQSGTSFQQQYQQHGNVNCYEQQNSQGLNSSPGNGQQTTGQGVQNQTIAEKIANIKNGNSVKAADLINNDKNQPGRNKTSHQLNIDANSTEVKCQCKNWTKKSRSGLVVFLTLFGVLIILGSCVGAIYGFRPQIKDWLLKAETATEIKTAIRE
ncbi:hypothetical protein [Spiroplasma endosymbiont of Polydrusus cervinus]|uniref:hypothetical protein n=1 Tax=Spiroplasma endosymbiont of Polydrusus cervinus TaxID=3066287 RepID=UPI0030CA91B4